MTLKIIFTIKAEEKSLLLQTLHTYDMGLVTFELYLTRNPPSCSLHFIVIEGAMQAANGGK